PRDEGEGAGGGGGSRGGSRLALAGASAGAGSGSVRAGSSAAPVLLTVSGDGSDAAAVSGVGFIIGSLATSLAVPSMVGGGRRRPPPVGRPLSDPSRSSLILRFPL